MVLQVSTADIVVIWKFEKNRVSRNALTVKAIRRALKLRNKGVLVLGVAGKHGGFKSAVKNSYYPGYTKHCIPSHPY